MKPKKNRFQVAAGNRAEVTYAVAITYEDQTGNQGEFEEPVTITLDLGSKYTTKDWLKLAKVNQDGTLTYIDYWYDAGKVCFITDTVSDYVVFTETKDIGIFQYWQGIVIASLILIIMTIALIAKKRKVIFIRESNE